MLDERVLARLHLNAVLSNFELLTKDDPKAASIAAAWSGSIYFKSGLSGPNSTLTIANSSVGFIPGKEGNPDIVLFFPAYKLLNNMFKGSGIGFPILLKGLTKVKGLITFMKLAKHMEEIMKGPNPPKSLKAELTLNTLARGIAVLANYDEEIRPLREHIPNGTA